MYQSIQVPWQRIDQIEMVESEKIDKNNIIALDDELSQK